MDARTAGSLIVMVFLCACGGDEPLGPSTQVTVMTRNLYLGADLTSVVASESVAVIPERVGAVLERVRASNAAARMELVADEIAVSRPDVVGLQEAVVFSVQTPSDFDFAAPARNAGEPGAPGAVETIDFLALLQAGLAARGLAYQLAVLGRYSDVELPANSPTGPVDVRLIDRNAILVRTGITATLPRTQAFMSRLTQFPIGGGNSTARVDVIRGWEAVDLTFGLARFTVVHTHLEAGGASADPRVSTFLNALQEGQARDLVAVMRPLPTPLVLLGDLNSPADGSGTTSHATIKDNGFEDAYHEAVAETGGHTCCADLDAPAFVANQRIDIVFHKGRVRAESVSLTGTEPTRRTPQGQFASDHAGVVARLAIENAKTP